MNLTIGDFYTFCLEKGAEHYDFGDSSNCALAQFLHAFDHPSSTVGGYTVWANNSTYTLSPGLPSILARNETFAEIADDLAGLDPLLPIGTEST